MSETDPMRPAYSDVKLTYDDFVLFPDDGLRHELLEGEHVVTPSPNTKHQDIVGNLHFHIRLWLETHPVGRVFLSPYDIVLSMFDVVVPDLVYFSSERAAAMLTPKHAAGAPNLVVEIASPGTRKRDETIKRRIYERFGVDEYWVVDPELDAVRVFRRQGERFGRPVECSMEAGDVLTSPLLPGLDLPLTRVFHQAGA